MRLVIWILPILFILILVYATFKKVKVYESFASGVSKVLPLLKGLFPYIASMLILAEIFEASGLAKLLSEWLSPVFAFLGIPKEITSLVLIKPFSGSGTLSVLTEIYKTYGIDSYIANCASVVYATGETIFYMSAIYFASAKQKIVLPVVIAIISNFIAIIVGCLFCRLFI